MVFAGDRNPLGVEGGLWNRFCDGVNLRFGLACVDISMDKGKKRRYVTRELNCGAPTFVWKKAPVAQLDRASDYGSEGLKFDSSRVHTSR